MVGVLTQVCSLAVPAQALLPDGKRVLMHGGHDPRSPADCYDDAYVLDTATWSWVGVEGRPDQRPSRPPRWALRRDGGREALCDFRGPAQQWGQGEGRVADRYAGHLMHS